MTSEFAVAVHALVYLNSKKTVLSSKELADNICTNPARIRKVMSKLKKSGLVSAKEGKVGGGYYIEGDPQSINLCDIYQAVDDRIIYSSWRSGGMDMDCLVASGMANILDNIYDELDFLCKNQLSFITIGDICKKMLGNQPCSHH